MLAWYTAAIQSPTDFVLNVNRS